MDPEILRLEDDGAPPIEVAAAKSAMRIGVKPKPHLVIVEDGAASTVPVSAGRPDTWESYLAWRRTKCRPWTKGADEARDLEEIDQATHEFVGELAEIGELFQDLGPNALTGDGRTKLIDECGDAFFCGAWAMDAWGVNLLETAKTHDGLSLVKIHEEHPVGQLAGAMAEDADKAMLGTPGFAEAMGGTIFSYLVHAMTNGGLTANAFKKLKFQRRPQDAPAQANRIMTALVSVNVILILAGATVADALAANRKKLDARFPDGHKPGVGGGIREGDGR